MIRDVCLISTGAASAYLVGRPALRLRRLGYLAALASQPFWIWAAYDARSWAMGALSLWYTFAWWDAWRKASP